MTKQRITAYPYTNLLVLIPSMFLLMVSSLCASEFSNITNLAGIVHNPSKPEGPLTMGTGVAFGDYNNDGNCDLYVPNGQNTALYHNLGDGHFVNVARSAGVTSLAGAAIWGDYDNDGNLDLFVNCWDSPEILYRNRGNGTFANVTQQAGIADGHMGGPAAFVDVDNDGDLDLYVGNYTAEGGNAFYRNNGNGTFTDVTATSGLEKFGLSLGICFFDFDNDSHPDLYLATDFGRDSFYRNNGDGTYEDISDEALGEKTPYNSMGIAVGDYDGDGFLDVYITDIGANTLYRNTGKSGFVDCTENARVANAEGIGWGTGFFDYDRDGWVDLYVINGDLLGDTSKSLSPNKLYRNLGNGMFADVSNSSGIVNTFVGRGAAIDDYDSDGAVDIFIGNEGNRNLLLRNNANQNHFLIVELIGVESNKSGIGARLQLTSDSLTQTREVCGGGGYLSFDSLPVEFGLGSSNIVSQLEVRWPSERVDEFRNVPANQSIVIREGESQYTVLYTQPIVVFPLGKRYTSLGRVKSMALYQNYPNPFNPETWMPYDLATDVEPTITIYNALGDEIRLLPLGTQPAGRYFTKDKAAYWDGRDNTGEFVSSGVYFYHLTAGKFSATRKMVVVR